MESKGEAEVRQGSSYLISNGGLPGSNADPVVPVILIFQKLKIQIYVKSPIAHWDS